MVALTFGVLISRSVAIPSGMLRERLGIGPISASGGAGYTILALAALIVNRYKSLSRHQVSPGPLM